MSSTLEQKIEAAIAAVGAATSAAQPRGAPRSRGAGEVSHALLLQQRVAAAFALLSVCRWMWQGRKGCLPPLEVGEQAMSMKLTARQVRSGFSPL